MLDVMATFEKLVELKLNGVVTAILSDSYLINGHLSGEIFADKQKRFKNGKRILTSKLNFSFQVMEHQFALTHSGNLYAIASWRQFDETWIGATFQSDTFYALNFLLNLKPERPIDFVGDSDLADAPEAELIKYELPNRRSTRSISAEAESASDGAAAEDRSSEIFELALQYLDKGELFSAFENARQRFFDDEKREVLIEYTTRDPDPFLLPMVALGFTPRWQGVLVLDGQFNVSQKATDYLADALLAKLPPQNIPLHLRDIRFQADLGL